MESALVGLTRDYCDVPPSGERVTINGTAILRMKDGQVVEHWGGPRCMYGNRPSVR